MPAVTLNPNMSGSDTVLWSIERDARLQSTVTAVALLDRNVDAAALRRRLQAAVDYFPKLRQRVVGAPFGVGHPHWSDYDGFRLEDHVRTFDGRGATFQDLIGMASETAEAGLDRSRPLWQMRFVDNMENSQAGFIQKFHHSLTDGVGGVELATYLLDGSRHPRHQPSRPTAPEPGDGSLARAVRRAGSIRTALVAVPPALANSALHPAESASEAWRTVVSVGRLLAPSGRRLSPLFGEGGTRWRFDTLEETLERLRRTAARADGTLNDVFVAAVAGGLHAYHTAQGVEVAALRMNLPVSFRGPNDPLGGNRFTPVRFALPVDEPDPVRRIHEVGRVCRQWRHEPALPLTDEIAEGLSRLPAPVTTAVMRRILNGVDFVATNVPGMPNRCYLAGAEVLRLFPFAPLSGAAVNVALLSHVGTACVGVNIDSVAVAQPELLMTCLRDAFAEMASIGDH
jgi:diacylglycerol O-acyltransferase